MLNSSHLRSGRRRIGSLAVAMTFVMAACSSDDGSSTGAPSTDVPNDSTAPVDSGDAPVASVTTADTAEAAGGTVTITDATGDVTVPVTDQGVLALDEWAAIALRTLDVDLVAINAFFDDAVTKGVLEADGDITLGASSNIETVAAADPALIVGIGHPNHVALQDEYRAIAPMLLPDFTVSWTEQTRAFGQATGRDDRAEAVIATIEGRIAALAAQVTDAGLAGQTVSLIQPSFGSFFGYGPTTLAGDIIAQLGFERSELQSGEGDFGFIEMAEELLPAEANADIVLSLALDGEPSLFDNPIVDTGDAITGDVQYTWSGNHAFAAWVILNDLDSLLFGDGSTFVSDDAPQVWSTLLTAIDGDGAAVDDAGQSSAAGDSDETAAEQPQKVVDLSDFIFDLAALDAAPIANIYGPEFLGQVLDVAPLTNEQRAAILDGTNVAPAFELNIEAVLALEPDLVITSTSLIDFYPSIDDLRSQVEFELIDDSLAWQERSRATAAATGRDGELDERIEAAEQSIIDLAARVEALGLTGTEVSLLRAFQGEVTSFNPPSIASSIVEQAGLTQPAVQLVDQPESSPQPDYAAQTPLSSELLGEHDAGYALIANTSDLSSASAELPPDASLEIIPVLGDEERHVVGSYFFWALNSVVGVERIVLDVNLLLDKIEAA